MDTQATIPTGGEGKRETPEGLCPDSETLAAFVDGRLGASERDRVASHVTHCDDCLFIVGETTAFLESERPADSWKLPPWLLPAGGLLAAAAVAVLVVRLSTAPPSPVEPTSTPTGPEARATAPSDDPWAALDVRALRSVLRARPSTARLSALSYLPPPRVTRSATATSVPLDVLAAAARIEETTAGKDDWQSRWTRGVAQLAGDRIDEAIVSLDGARPPDSIGVATTNALDIDRAAAHLARAERIGDAEAARRGLALADGVLARDASSLPALFNRALALEYLDRQDEAARAWRAYLARDANSPWAEEIRQRHVR